MEFIPLAEPEITEADIIRVSEQLASGFVGPGAAVEVFGNQLAALTGRSYALPVCSGTVALSISARALGLRAGDKVVVPAYGVLSVINAFSDIGLQPVLVDIDPVHGCLSPSALEAALTPDIKAVCYVSFLGNIGDSLQKVKKICSDKNICLIEDSAWSLGRHMDDQYAGAIGDISITSFSVPKIITCGQGGAVLCDKENYYLQAVRYSDQGGVAWRKTNAIETVGSNYRMSDINAALGSSQLASINDRHEQKQQIFSTINSILDERLVKTEDGWYPAQNVIFVKDKQVAIEKLRSVNVAAASPYGVYSKLAPYRDLTSEYFPGGGSWEQHAVFLPFGIGTSMKTMVDMAERVKALDLNYYEIVA